MKQNGSRSHNRPARRSGAGFSLIELMVAVAVFLIIGGAAVTLVRQNVPLFTSQQNQIGLNIAMRNGAAQMQLDVVNAGTGFYQGVSIPSWPVGVTIINSPPGTGCYDPVDRTYGPGCFDAMNVISIDSATPPSHPQDIGTNCKSTTAAELFVTPIGTTTLSQLAADFHTGDEVLVIKSDGSQMTTTVLTSDGEITGGMVKLAHNPTGANGVNDGSTGTNIDPLGISDTSDNNKLGELFCDTDWVLKLAPVRYWVDASDPADPKLMRTQGGQDSIVADQIIGFKVGAAVKNSTSDDPYSFDASTYSHDWSLIRSVRISMIARAPSNEITTNFHNTFDGGPYKIQTLSVIINPRNLSMND
jgi:prepilin-type N-terminal cleavage/methylation domain-containing protein